jgi:very-short-patch-repair endonuclease
VGARSAQFLYEAVMSARVPSNQTRRARELRVNATKHERKLWGMISRLRPKFTRQLPIGPYYADFACRQARFIVELDGGQHAQSEYDARRDAFLAQQGWSVLRIWNNELDENPDGVFGAISARAAECLGGTHPQPLASREERRRRPRC